MKRILTLAIALTLLTGCSGASSTPRVFIDMKKLAHDELKPGLASATLTVEVQTSGLPLAHDAYHVIASAKDQAGKDITLQHLDRRLGMARETIEGDVRLNIPEGTTAVTFTTGLYQGETKLPGTYDESTIAL